MSNSPFGFDAPEDSPGFLLWQTTTAWQRLIKKSLEEFDISHAQFVIMAIALWASVKKSEITQIDIVKMSNLDKMTVSKSLKKLVTVGLVERRENESDSRAKTVSLTASGKALTRKLVPRVEAIDAAFFGSLEEKEQRSLTKIFQKLAAH